MTRRRLLPVVVVLLLGVAGCASGSGLRVEGAEAPVTVTVTPSNAGPSSSATPTPSPSKSGPGAPAGLDQFRRTLLADPRVDPNVRTVLTNCVLAERCLRRGVQVDVMHTGHPQQVVTVHTVDGFSFGAFLLALEPAGPRLVWSLSAQQVEVYPGKQGDLVVESKVFGLNDRVCCPSGSKIEVYLWNGQQMTRTSEQYQEGD